MLICRSARNLSHQDKLPVEGFAEQLLELKGQDLLGVPLKVSMHASPTPREHPFCLQYQHFQQTPAS